MDQAKLGKETQAALREKEDEARHWKKLYLKAKGGDEEDDEEGGGDAEPADDGAEAGALGVDAVVKLQAQVRACGWGWTRSKSSRRQVLVSARRGD